MNLGLRIEDVAKRIGLSKGRTYHLSFEPDFPPPRLKIGHIKFWAKTILIVGERTENENAVAMLEIAVTVNARRANARPPLPNSTKRARPSQPGVEFIPNVNAVRFGGQRIRLEFDRHNYSIRDLIRVIKRKFHFKVSQRLLVDTLQQICFEKFGN